MYRFLPGPSFVWNQFILSWVRFVLDLYWPSHIWNEIYLYQILSMNVPNSIWTKFYLDTIYSKSTSIWIEFNHLCVPNFIGNVLMLSLKLVVYGMLMQTKIMLDRISSRPSFFLPSCIWAEFSQDLILSIKCYTQNEIDVDLVSFGTSYILTKFYCDQIYI